MNKRARSFWKSKKAVTGASFLVGAIITIASLIVIAPVVTNFMSGDDCKKMESACAWSVGLRATSTIKYDKKGIRFAPLLCKTCDVEIKDDKEQVKKQLADMMVRCWKMFGEGRYEEILTKSSFNKAVENGKLKEFLPEFKDTNQCFMCSAITIEATDKFKEGDKITYKEFIEYLMNNKYERVGKTYLEYIQSHGGPGNVFVLGDIKPNQAYGVSFAAKNKKLDSDQVAKSVGKIALGVSATAVGVVAKSPKVTATAGGYTAFKLLELGSDIYKDIYTNRDTSTIYLSDLKFAQQNCFKGDPGGK